MPLLVDGRPWGAISLQSAEPNAFDDSDASMLRAVAHQLAAALRSALLHERLERAQLGAAEALRRGPGRARRRNRRGPALAGRAPARPSAAGWGCPRPS